MSTIDQQFVEYIVKTLVNNPDKVKVDRRIDEKGVLLELTVDPEDVGRIIGRFGATAQSIRALLRALGTKHNARYNFKIANNDKDTSSEKTNSPVVNPTPTEPEATEEVETELAEKTRAELAEMDDLDI